MLCQHVLLDKHVQEGQITCSLPLVNLYMPSLGRLTNAMRSAVAACCSLLISCWLLVAFFDDRKVRSKASKAHTSPEFSKPTTTILGS